MKKEAEYSTTTYIDKLWLKQTEKKWTLALFESFFFFFFFFMIFVYLVFMHFYILKKVI